MLALLLVALAQDAADRHAGIEIGGSGVKVTVVEVRPDGLFRRVFGASRKTALTVLDGESFKAAAIDDTAKLMADYLDTCQRLYRVPLDRIHVVGSSGVP